jgi:hypothetical protein
MRKPKASTAGTFPTDSAVPGAASRENQLNPFPSNGERESIAFGDLASARLFALAGMEAKPAELFTHG